MPDCAVTQFIANDLGKEVAHARNKKSNNADSEWMKLLVLFFVYYHFNSNDCPSESLTWASGMFPLFFLFLENSEELPSSLLTPPPRQGGRDRRSGWGGGGGGGELQMSFVS